MEDKIYETLIATGKFRSDESFAGQLAQEIEDAMSFPVWQSIHCWKCGELNKVKYYSEAQIAKRLIEEYANDFMFQDSRDEQRLLNYEHLLDWLDRRENES